MVWPRFCRRRFIKVASEVGKGTEFQLFFPATDERVLQAQTDEYLPAGNGERILVVDDEQSILHIAGETLEAYGYRVSTAMDGADALALIRKLEPAMNGIDTIRAIRAIDPRIKVVLSSGSLNDVRNEGPPVAIDAYLNKPYTSSELLRLLRVVL
jgi:CheY-like chemotaxis protein